MIGNVTNADSNVIANTPTVQILVLILLHCTTVPTPEPKSSDNKTTQQNKSIYTTNRRSILYNAMQKRPDLHVYVTQAVLVPAGVNCFSFIQMVSFKSQYIVQIQIHPDYEKHSSKIKFDIFCFFAYKQIPFLNQII